jgi:predicted HicB family RNase H-like nuclease
MATLQVQEIPDSLYQQINKMALAQGYSLNTFVLRMLQRASY